MSPSITARRKAPSQKCSISSWAALSESSPRAKRSIASRCTAANRAVAGLARARTGITGNRGSSWTETTASRAAARIKACLNRGCAIELVRAHKAGAELHPGRPHLKVGKHRFAAPDAAGDKHRNLGHARQDLLRQNTGRDRPHMAARLASFDDDRIDPQAHELPRKAERRRKAKNPGTAPFDLSNRGAAWQTAGENDMAYGTLGADLDQFGQPRMHENKVDAERAIRQRAGSANFGGQQIRGHGARRDHTEPARVRNRGDEVALRDPSHGAAHDREVATENRASATPQPVKLSAPSPGTAPADGRHLDRTDAQLIRKCRARRRYEVPAAPARCIRPRSER